jgi:hypothetical protein
MCGSQNQDGEVVGSIYLTIYVKCPMCGSSPVEDCYDCEFFKGLNDSGDLIECAFVGDDSN